MEDPTMTNIFAKEARGLWTPFGEEHVINQLKFPIYQGVTLSEVVDALRQVAIRPHGYTRMPEGFDAFAFCHQQGYLHIEKTRPGSKLITYLFASPIHKRYASICL